MRILDANLNRAREALRVLEEHSRMVLNDARLTTRIKDLRHGLASVAQAMGPLPMLAARDTPGDVGTAISHCDEQRRDGASNVAAAAAKRAAEALRCIEEYAKISHPTAASRVERLRYELYTIEQELLLTSPRRTRLSQARLHVLVTSSLCRGDWREVCKSALAGGADVLQLREKELSDAELLVRAKLLRELTSARDALLFVNDRADIARLAGADGVHVGQKDLPVQEARQIAGPTVLIGKSTHSIEEARAAIAESPDYIAVGPMFPSPTKPDATVQGPSLLAEVAACTDLPLVAIGGITPENVATLRGPRPFAVASSSAVISSTDPASAAALLIARLTDAPSR